MATEVKGTANTNLECGPDTAAFEAWVKDLIAKGIAGNINKGGFAIYGNLKDDVRKFTSAGAANHAGAPYDKTTIIRFASQSKLLGAIIFAKALEENLLSLSDPVSAFLTEFDKDLDYYDQDGVVVTAGVPKGSILVSHLLSMSAGLGYYFTNWGDLYPLGSSAGSPASLFAKANKVRNEAIKAEAALRGLFWDWQFDPQILAAYTADPTGFRLPSMKKYIGLLTSVPLLFKPGTNSLRDVCYGTDYDVLGAVVNQAIINGGAGTDVWDYFKRKFLTPMNIKSFFQIGNPDKPKCLKKRLAETAFRRPTANKQQDGTEFAPNPSAAYVATQANQLAWTSSFPDDGFGYNEALFTKILVEYDPYQGYFGAGYGGTPYDYTKFFELLVGQGCFRGQQLISQTYLQLVVTPSLPEYISFFLLSFKVPPPPELPPNNFQSSLAGPTVLLAVGYNEHWCGGNVRGNTAFVDALYNNPSFTDSCIRWGSYYGTNYLLDLKNGNFVMAGTQEDANSLNVPQPADTTGSGDWASAIFARLQEGQLTSTSVNCKCNSQSHCHKVY